MHKNKMSELKDRRQKAMADLIREHVLANQEEVAARLSALGFEVTQATVSRDIDQIGALKVRRNGRIGYALPDQLSGAATPSRLASVLRDWVRSIDVAATIVVLKTPPGSAHLVGFALDEAALEELVGNISGDDTIFIATDGARAQAELGTRLRSFFRV